MCVKDRVILIDKGRTRSERRCDLAHAIAHIELGHRDRRNDQDEQAARRFHAKLLIDLPDLASGLLFSAGSVDEWAAEYLEVDMETLHLRVQHLHPAERAYLRQRLSELAEPH